MQCSLLDRLKPQTNTFYHLHTFTRPYRGAELLNALQFHQYSVIFFNVLNLELFIETRVWSLITSPSTNIFSVLRIIRSYSVDMKFTRWHWSAKCTSALCCVHRFCQHPPMQLPFTSICLLWMLPCQHSCYTVNFALLKLKNYVSSSRTEPSTVSVIHFAISWSNCEACWRSG